MWDKRWLSAGACELFSEDPHQWLVMGIRMHLLKDDCGTQFSDPFYLVRKRGRFGIGDRNKDGDGDRTVHGSSELCRNWVVMTRAMGCGQPAEEGRWRKDQIHVLSSS